MPSARELRRRTDAGAHQHRRRMDRAGGENDLLGREGLGARCGVCTRAPVTLRPSKSQRLDLALREDAQIGPPPHLVGEIGQRGGDALPAAIVLRRREIAVDEGAVLVLEIGQIRALERLRHRARVAAPFLAPHALHRQRPALAVQCAAAEIGVVLELAEIGQHVAASPSLGAERRPFVVIVGRAAVGGLVVDARAAAHDLALVVEHGRRRLRIIPPQRLRVGEQLHPFVRGIERRLREHLLDVGGHCARRRVRPRLDEQHLRSPERAESRLASTLPADPPPTMM